MLFWVKSLCGLVVEASGLERLAVFMCRAEVHFSPEDGLPANPQDDLTRKIIIRSTGPVG
jgi:hypothetical protein